MRFLVVFLLSLSTLIQGQTVGFVSPRFQDTADTGLYAGNSRWPLGSTQVVAFSTPWEEYRLEFWQQSTRGDSAKLSSQFSYNQIADDIIPQSFQWTVQTYEFVLSNSPIFFFWLFDATDSRLNQSSAYFNITVDTSVPASWSSSRALASSPTFTLSAASTVLITTSNIFSGVISSSTAPSSSLGTADTSKWLSAGAMAGIGVGASVGGILVFSIVGFMYVKRKRLQGERQQPPEHHDSQSMGYSIGSPETLVSTSQYTPKPPDMISYCHPPPSELVG
ncbi:hypothetical protein F5Y12DRAFT_597495 [Xylaria sp. FL1777]|nr:hypothetical protein F5Y12DRAFT_597495 [Xylaria sp. FL1777]